MRKICFILLTALFSLVSCDEIIPDYPDTPEIDYQGFGLYISVDELGNKNLIGQLSFDFTDGDGNVGLTPLSDSAGINLADTVKYNFFLKLYDLKDNEFQMVPDEDGGILKYRIPFLDKQPLSGTMELEISYPIIVHDTIFYTFYIYDRDYNRSNMDTTDIIFLGGINLDEI